MSITVETRAEAHEAVVATLNGRQKAVYTELRGVDGNGVTANELSRSMKNRGYFSSEDRNNVHPRLNELCAKELVQVVGKRKCSISGKTCAVYTIAN